MSETIPFAFSFIAALFAVTAFAMGLIALPVMIAAIGAFALIATA